MSKITRTTLKTFIRKNDGNLYIMTKSSFDGMTDCVQQNDAPAFRKTSYPEDKVYRRKDYSVTPVQVIEETVPGANDNNLGVDGLWLVGSSRDYFTPYDDGTFEGFEIYNCCGTQILARKK